MTLHEAQVALQTQVDEAQGITCALWQDIPTGEILFEHEADRQIVSASMIKVPIMMAALRLVARGAMRLDAMIAVEQGEILPDSTIYKNSPRDACLQELLTFMIILSDNTATNVLIQMLGVEAINAACSAMGLRQTVLARKMLDFEAIAAGRNNHTSARDMHRCFALLRQGGWAGAELDALGMDILLRQRSASILPRYLWQGGYRFAHKTGGLDRLSHDAGDFYLDGGPSYHLGVYRQDTPDIAGDKRRGGRMGKIVYDYVTTQEVRT